MRKLKKAVIAALTVGGLVALGSGTASAADSGDSHHGGTKPFPVSRVLGDATPQGRQSAEKKTKVQKTTTKKKTKSVGQVTAREANAQAGRVLRVGGLLGGLLEVPGELVEVLGGTTQTTPAASSTSGGINQNNQASGTAGGTNQNNQANGASGGTNQNNQVSGPTIAIGLFAPAIQQTNQ
ncbi:hypothetical protein [Streptomyces humi]|uniref:hypothetical protein n=1 Tax=Streptomyces humi TaxID=1428620 RepID=UPI0006288565|nr:hypothetical protein [Streptomyces humi]